ncbi:MAG: Maf family protein [Cyclobacteriaceae bacterium]
MNFRYPLILASNSPRRQYLMQEVGFKFTKKSPDADESFSPDMPVVDVAGYLARKKADSITVEGTEVVITADTVVILGDLILNKPADRSEAISMLQTLSGQTHVVITSFCIKDANATRCFSDRTDVAFNVLEKSAIEHYVDQFKPFDKAGAYGAQDCLPRGTNPCSNLEMEFLKRIGRTDLAEKTFTSPEVGTGMRAIKEIKGSYFNVMGLPIHLVYEQLEKY